MWVPLLFYGSIFGYSYCATMRSAALLYASSNFTVIADAVSWRRAEFRVLTDQTQNVNAMVQSHLGQSMSELYCLESFEDSMHVRAV